MMDRLEARLRIQHALQRSRVVALVGPRQCGKTTLAGQLVRPRSLNYFDLEDPQSLARLAEPKIALEKLRGIVVIDEVQHRPELFPVLRVLADRRPIHSRFLILGSATPELMRQSSESLAGRLEVVNLGGFTLTDVGGGKLDRHWLRGCFPLSFLARSLTDSNEWRRQFLQTFVQRDVTQFGFNIPAPALLRFWSMLGHCHGNVWNAAEPARSLGVSEPTARRHLDLLSNLFMVRQLPPWSENLGKRQVKAPKIYIRDSGILHQLLGIQSQRDLLLHPKCGASWEGYVVEEILRLVEPEDAYFWRTHQGAELDLLMFKTGKRIGVEIKRADAPTVTPSMRIALHDLKLERLVIVYPGQMQYDITDRISVVPLVALADGDPSIFMPRRRHGLRFVPQPVEVQGVLE